MYLVDFSQQLRTAFIHYSSGTNISDHHRYHSRNKKQTPKTQKQYASYLMESDDSETERKFKLDCLTYVIAVVHLATKFHEVGAVRTQGSFLYFLFKSEVIKFNFLKHSIHTCEYHTCQK